MKEEIHVSELIPAYALACLDEEENARVTDHLATCEACRAELASYRPVADQLGLAAMDVQPPEHLKSKVLSMVHSKSGSERAARDSTPPLSGWQALTAWFHQTAPAWSLASLVVILLLGIGNLLLWRQIGVIQEGALQTEFQTVSMVGTGAAPQATGMLVINANGEYGTLVVDHLPDLDTDHQYQLWLIRDGQRTNGGVFSVGHGGYGVLEINAPEPLVSYPAFGITIEPYGGSSGPTGEKVMGGEL